MRYQYPVIHITTPVKIMCTMQRVQVGLRHMEYMLIIEFIGFVISIGLVLVPNAQNTMDTMILTVLTEALALDIN